MMSFGTESSDWNVPTGQALVYREHGNPAQVLSLESGFTGRDASSADDLVLVEVLASPVNPSAINQIEGRYPMSIGLEKGAFVAGMEGVGRITRVGPQVKSLSLGDWVLPRVANLGLWRTHLVCSEGDLFSVPNTLPVEVAASLLTNPATAYRLLKDFVSLAPGDVVIQNGANSAVGRYVIQLAAMRGIKTINIVRDRPNFEGLERDLLALGATVVVKADRLALPETQDYITMVLGGKRAKLGLNCVGGLQVSDMLKLMEDGSTLVSYGGMSGKAMTIGVAPLIFKDIRFVGFWLTRWYKMALADEVIEEERKSMFRELIELFEQGKLGLPEFEKYPLEQWRQAVGYYSSGSTSFGAKKPLLVFNPVGS